MGRHCGPDGPTRGILVPEKEEAGRYKPEVASALPQRRHCLRRSAAAVSESVIAARPRPGHPCGVLPPPQAADTVAVRVASQPGGALLWPSSQTPYPEGLDWAGPPSRVRSLKHIFRPATTARHRLRARAPAWRHGAVGVVCEGGGEVAAPAPLLTMPPPIRQCLSPESPPDRFRLTRILTPSWPVPNWS